MNPAFIRRYRRQLRLWETDNGRDCGWTVERGGEQVAVLTDPRGDEMFWESYRVEIVTQDAALAQRMRAAEFWLAATAEAVIFRNREFGEVASLAVVSRLPFPEPGRLTVRGLYLLPVVLPRPWDRLVLWWRRRTSIRLTAR